MQTSPLSFVESKDDKIENVHGKTKETGIELELILNGFYISVGGKQSESIKDFEHTTGSITAIYDSALKRQEILLGIGTMNPEGLAVSLYVK